MGLSVGLIVGFIGLGILIVPIALEIYVSTKQTSTGNKKSLEAAAGSTIVAAVFYVMGLILAAYFSGKATAEKGIGFLEKNPELLA